MSKEIAEQLVRTDDAYLVTQMNNIRSSVNSGIGAIEKDNTSFASTTSIPSKEPEIVNKIVEASTVLLNKLNTEIDNILNVGENYKEMDNFLADYANTDLMFDLISQPVAIEKVTTYGDINDMDKLMNIEIPTIEGFNGKTATPVTPEVKESTPKKTSTPSYTPSTTKPVSSTTPVTKPSTKQETPINVEKQETKKEEIREDKIVEDTVEKKEETPVKEEVKVEDKKEVVKDETIKDEVIVEDKKEETVKKVSTQKEETKVTTKRVEKYVNGEKEDQIFVNEPDEEDILKDEETPVTPVEDTRIIDEYVEPEDIKVIPVEEENKQTYTSKTEKDNSGIKTAIGIAAGVGLTGAAAAVGYSAIKKKKEDGEYNE